MKHFTPFLALFFSMLISCSWAKAQTSGTAANRVAVNGIAYNLDKVNKTAAVIHEFYTDEAGKHSSYVTFIRAKSSFLRRSLSMIPNTQ